MILWRVGITFAALTLAHLPPNFDQRPGARFCRLGAAVIDLRVGWPDVR